MSSRQSKSGRMRQRQGVACDLSLFIANQSIMTWHPLPQPCNAAEREQIKIGQLPTSLRMRPSNLASLTKPPHEHQTRSPQLSPKSLMSLPPTRIRKHRAPRRQQSDPHQTLSGAKALLYDDCGGIDVESRTAKSTKLPPAIKTAGNLLRASRPPRTTTNTPQYLTAC
jgi:hypothetical protein